MAYNFRGRNLLNTRGTYDGSSSDSDSHGLDPDFRIRRPQRRSNQNNDVGASSSNPPRLGRPPRSRANRAENRRGWIARRRRGNRTKHARVTEEQVTKRTVLSWLINLAVFEENEVAWYLDPLSRSRLGEGKINKGGIECGCCCRQFTVGEFEVHVGSITRKPYRHIVLARSQRSLLECQIIAWNLKEEEERWKFNNIQVAQRATDKKDDVCMICADGGDLVCCDLCPSAFHAKCIFMETIPRGDWLCSYCVCKYCGHGDGTLKRCSQCEKQYHSKCGGEQLDLMNSPTALFCGNSCRKIYQGLRGILGVKHDLHDGLSWTLLQCTDQPMTGSNADDDAYNIIQCNSKIAVAWLVLNEFFVPVIDRHTRADIMQSVVYNRGSNFTRINYSGFYTGVLEKNDEIISAATIRVHGEKLAEMPYIGTREEYRRSGMARILESCVESALCALEVEKLVIPSMHKVTNMWIEKYCFSTIDEDSLRDLSVYNTVMFPSSVVRLQKKLAILPDLNMGPSQPNGDL